MEERSALAVPLLWFVSNDSIASKWKFTEPKKNQAAAPRKQTPPENTTHTPPSTRLTQRAPPESTLSTYEPGRPPIAHGCTSPSSPGGPGTRMS